MIEVPIPPDRRSSSRSEQQWPDMADLRSAITDAEEYARTHIVQRPVVAMIAAVGLGYVVAHLISRELR